jgi:4a-hydroxytetrahydrobiopterin dehydratase
MSGGLITDEEVAHALAEHPGWRREGRVLARTMRMKDFEDALAFVERVAKAAVDYHRRPDMCISENNHVRLSIANLHHAGFTIAEIRLARKVDALLEEHHPGATPVDGR